MKLAIIAAIAQNNVIGKDNAIPWQLKEDMKRFKYLTTQRSTATENPLIMGRNTYESLPRKPLPSRKNIVLTSRNFQEENVLVVNSLEQALQYCKVNHPENTAYIIGGQKVYEQSLPLSEILELTRINQDFEGNVFFPQIDFSQWEKTYSEPKLENGINYTFETYFKKTFR
jgi:dihydrofolate reductase